MYARTARFTTGSPRNLTLTADGERILFCRSASGTDPALGLWALDVGPGAEPTARLVVDPATLGGDQAELPAAERARRERARESASGIVAFSTNDAGTRVCFALAGSLFLVEVDEGRVTAPNVGEAVFDPRVSPDGMAVAWVSGGRFQVAAVDDLLGAAESGQNVAGSGLLVDLADDDPWRSHGRAEFVAAEEMGRSRGYWWSPDGTRLLVANVDENPVDQWWIADPAHPDRAPNEIRYPGAGTTNATVGLDLVTLDGACHPIDWAADPTSDADSERTGFEYLADVVWQAGHPPLLVRQARHQRLVSLAELDLDTRAVTEIATITDDTWVELMPGAPRWSGAGLLTIADTDGARRLLLDGTALTGPEIHVRSILGETGPGWVVVTAWTDPTEVQLLAVPLAGGQPRSLTTTPGVHVGAVDGSTLVVTSTTPDQRGSTTTVHRLPPADPGTGSAHPGTGSDRGTAEPVATIADHSADPGFAANPTFLRLGERQLATALFLPEGHDGSQPLPVILDPYGGPHAQRVLKTHHPHLVSRWLAEQGYAVVVTDGRGTPGRGPAWEREVWGNLADPVLDDQVAALDATLARHPFLDGDRVGIRGWSFGGYLAALAVLRRPDRFQAAVAGAPVTAWELYDTHYTERYLGHPATDPDHYRRSNLFTEGERLELHRPLLIIHGLADDNVVAAHTLRFSTELLASGCPHQVLPLSGVTHMTPQEAVAENLLRLQLRFFDDTIGPSRPEAARGVT